jgi:hypothetical protein
VKALAVGVSQQVRSHVTSAALLFCALHRSPEPTLKEAISRERRYIMFVTLEESDDHHVHAFWTGLNGS